MQEPCKTCDRRSKDLGGCRCQAFLLAGDAAATDPVCSLSPQRPKVDAILNTINSLGAGLAPSVEPSLTNPDWLYRPNPS
jgi:pyrroloquinoline quinone biosynthesis protein E